MDAEEDGQIPGGNGCGETGTIPFYIRIAPERLCGVTVLPAAHHFQTENFRCGLACSVGQVEAG